MHAFWSALARRSILIGLGLALLAITAIGVAAMTTSMVVAEQVQGSGSAINIAGSLRRLSHRMGAIVLSDAENGVADHRNLRAAIDHFEQVLNHPAMRTALQRNPDSDFAHTYRSVHRLWVEFLKPLLNEEAMAGVDRHPPSRHNELLATIDAFVDNINGMVAQLENDTEENIRQLRSILVGALVLTILVMLAAIYSVHRGVVAPLSDLMRNAARIAAGDFTARASHVNQDELGQVGQAFNMMTDELAKLYLGLEQRVAEKTAELTRSNRALELLYHSIARLYNAPLAPETYRATLADMEQVLGLRASLACLLPGPGGPGNVLASSLAGTCADQGLGDCTRCQEELAAEVPWTYRRLGDQEILTVPLRDAERHYGVLRLALAPGERLETWQADLLEALSRHIGIAMGISHKTEQERLLALQEERSIIARELHDSLAQSLSYMKIQVSLMQPMLADPERLKEARLTLRDLREGITAAYRQLRELLATFRLRMEGDFFQRLQRTVAEYGARGGLAVQLEMQLEGCRMSPNQEIHVLQIIREALANILRHAHARNARVDIGHRDGDIVISVADDGRGLADGHEHKPHHYGLAIMRERADALHGQISIGNRPDGGAQVTLLFRAASHEPQRNHQPEPLHQA